jgi:hypothetical protein
MKEVTLPSGRMLKISLAPFSDGRQLFEAIAAESKNIEFKGSTDMDIGLFKDAFCVMIPSKMVNACLMKCMSRATIEGLKISEDSFSEEEHRQDYLPTLFEVAKENVLPFVSGPYAKLLAHLRVIFQDLASGPKKTTS